ncbi:MAG: hypothetical protein K2V38_20810, partial [Gemmataceae bacterium]|nr:hypothetical protein [Gemmataceae bacterium]
SFRDTRLPENRIDAVIGNVPFSDLKRLSMRFGATPDWYSQAYATRLAPATFRGDQSTFPHVAAPTQGAPSRYRLDPAHARRGLFVPQSYTVLRPAVVPSFLGQSPLALTAGAVVNPVTGAQLPTGKPGLLAQAPYPGPQPRGLLTDFAGDNQWYNIQLALGSVDVNRPLADYRNLNDPINVPNPRPLSATNMGNVAQADADRRQLAKDIFARLIVATGAAGQVTFDAVNGVVINLPQPTGAAGYALTPLGGGAPVNFTQPQYDALRYLAQIAVNVVDYIDNDDVVTVFDWNPSPNGLAADLAPAAVGDRVVFGVEKPRLVINEAYSEITNDPSDNPNGPPDGMGNPTPLPANSRAHVRFWAELVNPTNTPYLPPNATTFGPLGDGSVSLNAYQIQIGRAARSTGVAKGPDDLAGPLFNPAHPLYEANTTGRFGAAPDATFTFPVTAQPNQASTVSPNNAQYAPPANLPANGFVLVGPPVQPKNGSAEFNPPAPGGMNAGPWANAVQSPALGQAQASTGMGYTFAMPNGAATLSSAEFKRHVLLLRRTVNPYLPPNDPASGAFNPVNPVNPYVTVDTMDFVPAFDAVHRFEGQGNDRGSRGGMGQGYDPVAERFSVGKVQPLAGHSFAAVTAGAGRYNQYTFANAAPGQSSMVLAQTAAPAAPPMGQNPNAPRNTFGRHNGTGNAQPAGATVNTAVTPATLANQTIMLPFDWLTHFDRPLESKADLFSVRDVKPYKLTDEFVRNNDPNPPPTPAAATGLTYDRGLARWRSVLDGLSRGLEYLDVKPHDFRIPHGGRVSGLVNVNVIQDQRVALGLWDAPAAGTNPSGFDVNFVNDIVWGNTVPVPTPTWMNSRTPLQYRADAGLNATASRVPVPSASIFDQVAGVDRPFLSLGAPAALPNGQPLPFAYSTGGTSDHTVLRSPTPGGQPYLYLPPTAAGPSEYAQSEPVRKVMNNTTTRTSTFVVYLTIGYFDVTFPTSVAGVPVPQFGAEVYDKVPGDLRQKFVAVVDASNMGLKPVPAAGDPDPHAQGQPFFTALTATARPTNPADPTIPSALSVAYTFHDPSYNSNAGALYFPSDGQQVLVAAGTQLVVGFGADEQRVTVSAVIGPGQLAVTGLARPAWGGSCVSNIRPGYAGPQPNFDYTSPKYKPVIPYVERLK